VVILLIGVWFKERNERKLALLNAGIVSDNLLLSERLEGSSLPEQIVPVVEQSDEISIE
jgi:hypothetical protein